MSAKQFSILDYGAAGGGTVLSTAAIQQAIDACHAAGGGEVCVPAGLFLTGTVTLKDRVSLCLQQGAVLLGSSRIADYPEQPKAGSRMDQFLSRALIVARGAKDISISGPGVIDGQGRLHQNDFMAEERRLRRHRPLLVWFDRCERIEVREVTFKAAGFWTHAYSRCKTGRIAGVRVTDSVNDNNDGCDLVDSRDFVVEHCDIDCIDDGICLKAFTEAGCRNIVIRNNRVKSLCNAIKTGTDSSGQGFQDLLIERNELYQVGRAGIALETTDGGILRHVIVRDIRMDVVGTPLFIKLGDRQRPTVGPDGREVAPERIGCVEDIRISRITASVDDKTKPVKEEYTGDELRLYEQTRPVASSLTGLPGHPIRDLVLEDIAIEVLGGDGPRLTAEIMGREVPENSRRYPNPDMMGILPAYGFFLRHATGVTLNNVTVTNRLPDPRPAIFLDDVHDSTFTRCARESISGTPLFVIKPGCTGVNQGT